MMMMKSGLLPAACALGLGLAPSMTVAAETDWMTDEGGVLELKLAHADRNGPDGGILRIDCNKRVVAWEGIPGDIGCKQKVEASFDDVKAVTTSDAAGFVLELKKGKTKKLTFIPVPHVQWLRMQAQITGGGFGQSMEGANLSGPDGARMKPTGNAAGAGPNTKKLELPKQVVADTRQAADAILTALGRE